VELLITVVGMWEPSFSEYEQIIEYRMWKQTIAAFNVDRWIMVGKGPECISSFEHAPTMQDALETISCQRVFMVPECGQELDRVWRVQDHSYIFGNAQENLLRYVSENDQVAHLKTPESIDMFAACVLPAVLLWP
jgi:hypothetical protein